MPPAQLDVSCAVIPSSGIQRPFQTYTQAFNRQQGRKGPLFEGRFRHVHVDRDEYVVHLCRYVHLNPVAAGRVSDPADWPYSNYLEWIERCQGTLVDRALVLQFFPTPVAYVALAQDHVAPGVAQQLRPYVWDGDDVPESGCHGIIAGGL